MNNEYTFIYSSSPQEIRDIKNTSAGKFVVVISGERALKASCSLVYSQRRENALETKIRTGIPKASYSWLILVAERVLTFLSLHGVCWIKQCEGSDTFWNKQKVKAKNYLSAKKRNETIFCDQDCVQCSDRQTLAERNTEVMQTVKVRGRTHEECGRL